MCVFVLESCIYRVILNVISKTCYYASGFPCYKLGMNFRRFCQLHAVSDNRLCEGSFSVHLLSSLLLVHND